MYFVKRRWLWPLSALGEAAEHLGVLPDTCPASLVHYEMFKCQFYQHTLCSKMTFHMLPYNAIQPFDWKYHQNALDARMNCSCFVFFKKRNPGSLLWFATGCAFISSDLKWGARVFISYHLTSKFKLSLDCVGCHQKVGAFANQQGGAWGNSLRGQRWGRTGAIALMIAGMHLEF